VIRLLLVDDHHVVRAGVRAVFTDAAAFDVIGEAGTVADGLSMTREHTPDVVLLDITLPDGSGLDAVPHLLKASPKTRLVMLSVHEEPAYVLQAVRAGAHGFLRKDASPAILREAVRAVHNGGAFFGADVAVHLAAAIRGEATPTAQPLQEKSPAELLERLTPREREVLQLVAAGKSSKEIAAALGISVRTAEAHRDSIGKKTGIRSVAGLTRLTVRT
jgi:DNA-binding NarL/FixJ family response regulator